MSQGKLFNHQQVSSAICFVNCLRLLASSIMLFFSRLAVLLQRTSWCSCQWRMLWRVTSHTSRQRCGGILFYDLACAFVLVSALVFYWNVFTCKIQCNRSAKRLFFGHKLCISGPYFLQPRRWFWYANYFWTLKFKFLFLQVKAMFIMQ